MAPSVPTGLSALFPAEPWGRHVEAGDGKGRSTHPLRMRINDLGQCVVTTGRRTWELGPPLLPDLPAMTLE